MLSSIQMTATRRSTVNGVTTITENTPVDFSNIIESIHICDGKTDCILLKNVHTTQHHVMPSWCGEHGDGKG